MKTLLATLAAIAALTFLGCGAGTDSSSDLTSRPADGLTRPKSQGPSKLVIKDLELGSGPAARLGDRVSVRYICSDYFTGKELVRRWGSDPPLPISLGYAGFSIGWEEGIEGMRVGGRRKLIIPSHLAEGQRPIVYLVELVRLKST